MPWQESHSGIMIGFIITFSLLSHPFLAFRTILYMKSTPQSVPERLLMPCCDAEFETEGVYS